MSKIISKLDLNKTPQLADNNSLIFAKNIKILKDGTIGPDDMIDSIISVRGAILGQIVGLNSIIYLFVAETSESNTRLPLSQFYSNLVPQGGVLNSYSLTIANKYINHTYNWSKGQELSSYVVAILLASFGGNTTRQVQELYLVSNYPFNSTITIDYSYILNNEEVFASSVIHYNALENKVVYNIYSYNETSKELNKINSAWSYSGGKIHGTCTTNNTGEIILTVCEYFEKDDNNLVPIKHINLSHADIEDETLYTQTPNIPLTNLVLHKDKGACFCIPYFLSFLLLIIL